MLSSSQFIAVGILELKTLSIHEKTSQQRKEENLHTSIKSIEYTMDSEV